MTTHVQILEIAIYWVLKAKTKKNPITLFSKAGCSELNRIGNNFVSSGRNRIFATATVLRDNRRGKKDLNYLTIAGLWDLVARH